MDEKYVGKLTITTLPENEITLALTTPETITGNIINHHMQNTGWKPKNIKTINNKTKHTYTLNTNTPPTDNQALQTIAASGAKIKAHYTQTLGHVKTTRSKQGKQKLIKETLTNNPQTHYNTTITRNAAYKIIQTLNKHNPQTYTIKEYTTLYENLLNTLNNQTLTIKQKTETINQTYNQNNNQNIYKKITKHIKHNKPQNKPAPQQPLPKTGTNHSSIITLTYTAEQEAITLNTLNQNTPNNPQNLAETLTWQINTPNQTNTLTPKNNNTYLTWITINQQPWTEQLTQTLTTLNQHGIKINIHTKTKHHNYNTTNPNQTWQTENNKQTPTDKHYNTHNKTSTHHQHIQHLKTLNPNQTITPTQINKIHNTIKHNIKTWQANSSYEQTITQLKNII